MNYGAAIQRVRKARGIKQKELAEAVGITGSYLSTVETGGKIPRLVVLQSISRHLDVPFPILILLASEERDLDPLGLELKQQVDEGLGQFIRSISEKT